MRQSAKWSSWRSLALVAVVCSIGCKHWGDGSVTCTPLPDDARAELEATCGLELEDCTALEWWLSDVEAACRAAAVP